MPLPLPPPTQALSSTTFRPPPLDGSLTLPEIYEYNFLHNGDHAMFVYDEGELIGEESQIKRINWREAGRAVHNAARYLRSGTQTDRAAGHKRPVVALIGVFGAFCCYLGFLTAHLHLFTEQFSFFAITAGLIRLGYLAFPISPKNSEAGIAHLLEKMSVDFVLVSRDAQMRRLVEAGLEGMSGPKPTVLGVPLFEELFTGGETDDDLPPLDQLNRDLDEPVLTLHSSGMLSLFLATYVITRHHRIHFISETNRVVPTTYPAMVYPALCVLLSHQSFGVN